MKRTTRRVVVAALVGGMLAGTVAMAAWVATGTGTGSAQAITATDLVVTDGTASPDLYPGFTDGDLYLDVENPNPYDVTVTTVEQAVGIVTSDAGAACEDADTGVSLDPGAIVLPVPVDIAAGDTESFTVADVVNMTNASVDACQGATFSIPVTVTGESDA
jgi:hypothetical protein